MRASELWALSQGKSCYGDKRCHWCAAPCQPGTPHDDLLPVPFVRSKSKALCPASLWICVGCDLFRRRRRTVHFLEGGFRDSQCPQDWGWLVTDEARAIRSDSSQTLYKVLLAPPKSFCLALLDPLERGNGVRIGGKQTIVKNLPHLWAVNEEEGALAFTVNNAPYEYVPYELEMALSTKDAQMSPGVRVLVRLLGAYPPLEAKKDETEMQAETQYSRARGFEPTKHVKPKSGK